jgi:Protein of unknown function with HXXEE motif
MKRQYFPWLYLALGFAQTAHSVEEVLTGLWRNMDRITQTLHLRFFLVPHLSMPVGTFAAGNLVIVAALLGISPFVYLKRSWAIRTARVIAVIETINGIGHITAALVTGGYFPGCISGIALLAFGIPLWAVPSIRRFPSGAD